jgi:ribosomal protein L1
LDFSDQQLIENLTAVTTAVENLKPAVLKNRLFKKVTIAPSMGPGVQIQL